MDWVVFRDLCILVRVGFRFFGFFSLESFRLEVDRLFVFVFYRYYVNKVSCFFIVIFGFFVFIFIMLGEEVLMLVWGRVGMCRGGMGLIESCDLVFF